MSINHNFWREEKGEPKRIEPRSCCLPAKRLTARPHRLTPVWIARGVNHWLTPARPWRCVPPSVTTPSWWMTRYVPDNHNTTHADHPVPQDQPAFTQSIRPVTGWAKEDPVCCTANCEWKCASKGSLVQTSIVCTRRIDLLLYDRAIKRRYFVVDFSGNRFSGRKY